MEKMRGKAKKEKKTKKGKKEGKEETLWICVQLYTKKL